jgi:hypothetical protein
VNCYRLPLRICFLFHKFLFAILLEVYSKSICTFAWWSYWYCFRLQLSVVRCDLCLRRLSRISNAISLCFEGYLCVKARWLGCWILSLQLKSTNGRIGTEYLMSLMRVYLHWCLDIGLMELLFLRHGWKFISLQHISCVNKYKKYAKFLLS